jgi:Plasmid pRiA4b ORF-3-like protein
VALPGQKVLQLRIALEEVRPVIWRRLLVPGSVRLNRLHEMLNTAMGWTDSHLHQFRVDGALYGMQFDDYPDDELDEAAFTVIGAVGMVRRFFYDYDFGDDWNHEVVVEDVSSWPWGLKHAVCLGGERACPPEDVGGVPGFEEFLEVLADPDHEDRERMVVWSGGDYDPERFSLVGTNIALQRLRVRG